MENFLKYSGIYLAKHFAYEGGIWITMESVRSGLEEAACSTAADEKYTCNRGGGGTTACPRLVYICAICHARNLVI